MNSNRFLWFLGASSVLIAIAVDFGVQASRDQRVGEAGREHRATGVNGLTIPQPLTAEHRELREELLNGAKEAGEIGGEARKVEALLNPHFEKEEQSALPLLGLLVRASKGDAVPDTQKVAAMEGKLKADLPGMLDENRRIAAAIDGLQVAANKSGKTAYIHFAEELKLHAQTEEQVLYPAALLVGEYLELTNRK